MKQMRAPQEKFEYTRKIFNAFLIGLVCSGSLYFTLTII